MEIDAIVAIDAVTDNNYITTATTAPIASIATCNQTQYGGTLHHPPKSSFAH